MLFNRFVPVDEATGFYTKEIEQSCRFNDDDSAYLYWTPSASDRRTWTFSTWVKICNLVTYNSLFACGTGDGSEFTFRFNSLGQLYLRHSGSSNLTTSAKYRDPTAWMHVVLAFDTTESTEADRIKYYVNGLEITAFSEASYPSLNAEDYINSAAQHEIARFPRTTDEADFYLAETIFVDGSALAATDFGEFKSGIWIPKNFSGAFGTNGFHLDFADSGDLGNDVSGNANDFTSSGLAANDQVLDTPTNNFCTLNPLNYTGGVLYNNGNLGVVGRSSPDWTAAGDFPMKTGKWYFEFIGSASGNYATVGIVTEHFTPTVSLHRSGNAPAVCYYANNGYKYIDGSGTAYGDTYTTSDVIGVAIDLDSGQNTIEFFKNNVSQGSINIDSGYTWLAAISDATSGAATAGDMDFGQHGFTYTPPSGFLALCSESMADPTIEDSADGYHALEYTGDASDDRSLGSAEFDVTQGALLWIKNKAGGKNHHLYDTVRGAGEVLHSNDTDTEATENGNIMQAFITAGFQVGDTDPGINDNANNYVAWLFRVAAAYGLDIVTYSGTGAAHAISHNLGVIPELIFIKNRDYTDNWRNYHHHALNKTDPETDAGSLNQASAWSDSAVWWNDTAPTSTEFTVGTDNSVNKSGDDHLAILFASIPQFLKVFSYTGNGNADGPYVPCGFRPAFVFVKDASTTYQARMIDAARNPYNPVTQELMPSETDAESSAAAVDFLARGFKIRATTNGWNNSGNLHVGVAIAGQPEKYANAR